VPDSDYIRVNSKEEFLQLLARIVADQNDWPNSSAQDFVQALGSWLEDADGYYQNTGQTMDTSRPSWQLFADAVQAARIYE
jgi:hypothetical protein